MSNRVELEQKPVKFCPLFSHGTYEAVTCLKEHCTMWLETENECGVIYPTLVGVMGET